VYLLGPVQLHDPPLDGCGPRSTTVEVELAVALDSSVQVAPPLIEMYGVIVVGVQLTVKAIVVLAVRLAEVPLTVIVAEPTGAELLGVRVSMLLPLVGLEAKVAATPLGRPEAASVTLPVNPFCPVTVTVDFPEVPWAMLSDAGEAPPLLFLKRDSSLKTPWICRDEPAVGGDPDSCQQDAVEQRFRAGRTSGDVDVNGNDCIHSAQRGVVGSRRCLR
jgi:hypothetical protein